MQSFKEFVYENNKSLNEMVTAVYGDWNSEKESLGSISETVLELYYIEIDKLLINDSKYSLYKMNSNKDNEYYLLGYFQSKVDPESKTQQEKIRFYIVLQFKLTHLPEVEQAFNLKNVFNCDEVEVSKKFRGQGISKFIYSYFAKKIKYNLVSDEQQYFGARKLWASMSEVKNIIVDIFDIKTLQYIEKSVELKHGPDDWEFDSRIYSYDIDKKDIRMIMKSIN